MNRIGFFAACTALTLSSVSHAAMTICKINSQTEVYAPRVASWSVETGMAKIQFSPGNTIEGRVTASRPYNNGAKVNLFFPGNDRQGTYDMEFIVFPVNPGRHRILGVNYDTVDGMRFLHSGHGNFEADCNTL